MRVQVTKSAELKGHSGAIYSLSKGFSPTTVLSCSGDKMLAHWDVTENKFTGFSVKLPSIIYSSLFIELNNLLLIGTASGSLHVVDVTTKQEIKFLQFHKGGIFKIEFLPSSKSILFSTANGYLIELDLELFLIKKEVKISDLKIRCVAVDEELNRIYLTDGSGEFHVLELTTFKKTISVQAHQQSCNCIAIHPNGKHLITGGKDAHLNVFDKFSFEKLISIPAHNFAIYSCLFLGNTNYIATASRDKTIKIWDATTFEFLLRINKENYDAHSHSVNSLLWLDETSQLISAGDDQKLMVWNIN